jgi:hypothetical protein
MPEPTRKNGWCKQKWVWAFADAYMLISKKPIAHIEALELGYRFWNPQANREPYETAHDELAWQQSRAK